MAERDSIIHTKKIHALGSWAIQAYKRRWGKIPYTLSSAGVEQKLAAMFLAHLQQDPKVVLELNHESNFPDLLNQYIRKNGYRDSRTKLTPLMSECPAELQDVLAEQIRLLTDSNLR